MRRIGRDKVQLAGLTVVGMLGFLLLLPLLGDHEPPPLPKRWKPSLANSGAARGPIHPSQLASALPAPAQQELATAVPSDDAAAAKAADAAAAAAAAEKAEARKRRRRGQRAEGEDPAAEQAAQRPARLTGQVVDPTGRAVMRATVVLRMAERGRRPQRREGEAERRKQLETDALGRFQVELAPGRWSALASADGFAASDAADVGLEPGQELALPEPLRLTPAGLLRGMVQDGAGAPVAGAQVSIESRGDEGFEAKSGPDGRFELSLAEGVYRVTAEAPGFVRAVQGQVAVAANTGGEATLVMGAAARLDGMVLDAEGRPLPKGRVFVYRQGRRLGEAAADEQGKFTVDGIDPGPLELFARAEDYGACARAAVELRAGQVATATLRLAPGARIVGRVTSPTGAPLPETQVLARSVVGDVRREGKTDADGRFTVANLYPGKYRLTVPGPSAAPRADVEVAVQAGDATCDLVASPGATLSGVVQGPDGAPLPQAQVFAIKDGQQRATVPADAQGAFRVEGLEPGSWRLFVRQKDGLVGILPLEVGPDAVLTGLLLRVLPPARLRGRILDPDGRPVPGIALEVRGKDAPVRRRAETDAQGAFEMLPFYDGSYTLYGESGSLALLARRLGQGQARLEPVPFAITGGRDAAVEVRLVYVPATQ